MTKTPLAVAIEKLGPEAASTYFALCAERGVRPDPDEMIASHWVVIVVDVDGVAILQHRFDI